MRSLGPRPHVLESEPHTVMLWTWVFQEQRPGIKSLLPTPSSVDTKGVMTVSGVAGTTPGTRLPTETLVHVFCGKS